LLPCIGCYNYNNGSSHIPSFVSNTTVDGNATDEEKCTIGTSSGKFDLQLSKLQGLNLAPSYEIGYWKQLSLVTYCTVQHQSGERITTTALMVQMAYLFFTALFWLRIPNTTDRVFEKNSLFFFILIAQANGIVTSAVIVFEREWDLVNKRTYKEKCTMYQVSS
jgi:hypothetical protein